MGPAAEGLTESRKLVTILFSDVTGSTALGERLDAESLNRVMARWFHSMREVIERHGGTVQKFIGDAVMAVFGMPVTHEDDALRAVRAASELPRAMADVNSDLERDWGVTIQIRTGVNSGEVMTGNPDAGDALVLGDPVNLAARLEQAAGPGEVLIGPATWELVRDAAQTEPVTPLSLKGKSEPVAARRLLAVTPDVPGRARLDAPMVDRVRQLRLLGDTFEAATEGRTCWLLTLLGLPGIGKTRLAAEFVAGLKDEATVLQGRCLPYGEGITYRPIVEAIRQAATMVEADDSTPTIARLSTLLAGDEHADLIVQRLGGLLGVTEPAGREELPWAVRRLLEVMAVRRPLVLVLDDLHWAEPALLDLVEHLTEWTRDVPVLIVCIARPELPERRPSWGGGRRNAIALQLEPLATADSDQLLNLILGRAPLDPAASRRLVEVAEGNPLFLQELLAVLVDRGLLVRDEDRWTPQADLTTMPIPSSIATLLGARIDQLDREEHDVLGMASVAGLVFYRQALHEMAPPSERAVLDDRLASLSRRDFVRADRSYLPGLDAYRFRHVLIRDVAYQALPKARRAELHERLADWLQAAVGDRTVEYQALVGHHLELAYRYRAELGPVDGHGRELAHAAADRLQKAAQAAWQSDRVAAARLLERTADLLAPGPERAEVLADLGFALLETGSLERGDRALQEAAELVGAGMDRRLAWRVKLDCSFALLAHGRPRRTAQEMRRETEQAISELTELGDDAGLARAWIVLGEIHNLQGQLGAMAEANERASEHARRAGGSRLVDPARIRLRVAIVHGPIPVEEGLQRGRDLLEQAKGTRRLEAVILTMLGRLEARRGNFDEARRLHSEGSQTLEDLGLVFNMATAAEGTAEIEWLAGDVEKAERHLRRSHELLGRLGNRDYQTMVAAELGEVLGLLDRGEEAARLVEESELNAAPDDLAVQIAWRKALAGLEAAGGSLPEAERLAREAVGIAEQTDFLQTHGDALMSLSDVLRAAGRTAEAVSCLEAALALYERKGTSVLADRARAALGELRGGSGEAPGDQAR
jgi:class 3 adenylate cyclase/tetratricopeptide (TPR) repeat protein